MIVIDQNRAYPHFVTRDGEIAWVGAYATLKLSLLDEAFDRCHDGDVPATRSDDTDPAELIDAGRDWLERLAADLISDLEAARLAGPAARRELAADIGVDLLDSWEMELERRSCK